ncbi:hypothetical protein KIK84_14320 [Curvibacter sp. CHRR-16]|uniref:pectate lyase family protein n=1 Tax=Curvibacter sp. CHRR-16 TaxID=2835872 RepID=UPI001BDAC66F|nr:hypothetical protein [Curvibacter sp. CHRR-16]MBT0571500.1 hypothetical protein [Curvibacter sp. CHRR-16]
MPLPISLQHPFHAMLLGYALLSLTPTALADDEARQVAPTGGWASVNGGTNGGAAAKSTDVYTVTSPSALLQALRQAGERPKIIWVAAPIDMTAADNGGAFQSHADQDARGKISIPSNTTLIGAGDQGHIRNAFILIENASNVIVRNLSITNPCDVAPVWDPNDGKDGNWNSEFDGITIDKSHHIWIDHNTFTDLPISDANLPVENGKTKQCHDGALDVKKGSDFVTISYNVFDSHEKNNLIGHSDSSTVDEGHLTITLHHNHFTNVAERAPRVRFGQVHVYSNYYEGDRKATAYHHQYSIGVGYKAQILSEHNAFRITGASQCSHVVKNPGSASKTGAISDTGSQLNGADLNLASNCNFAPANWTIPYAYTPTPAAQVPSTVPAQAGAGKLLIR